MAIADCVLSGIGLALWALVLVLVTGGAAEFWNGFKNGARDGASISLVQAAKAADVFSTHYEKGFRLIDPDRTVTARKALGLATTPPTSEDTGREV